MKKSGFTLVEMMISFAILMVVILGVSMQYMQQMKMQSGAALQTQARVSLNEIISKIKGTPNDFPAIYSASNLPISFIGCYDHKGVPMTNSSGHRSFVAKFLNEQERRMPTEICASGAGGLEIHITRDQNSEVTVEVVILPSGSRQYNPSVSYFSTKFFFESSI